MLLCHCQMVPYPFTNAAASDPKISLLSTPHVLQVEVGPSNTPLLTLNLGHLMAERWPIPLNATAHFLPPSPQKSGKRSLIGKKQKNVPTKSEDADWHKSKKVISSPALTRIVGPAHIVKMSRRAGPLHKHARCTPESDLKAITITSHLPSRLSSPKMN